MKHAAVPRLLLAWALVVVVAGIVGAATRPGATEHVTVGGQARAAFGAVTPSSVGVTTATAPGDGIDPVVTPPTLPITIPTITIPPVTIPTPPLDQRCPADWVLQHIPSNAAQSNGEIAGRITGPCNRPVGGICATLWQNNGGPGLTRPDDVAMQTRSDANGYYWFEGVPERDNLVLDLKVCGTDGSERRDMPHYDGHARTEDWINQPPMDRFSTPYVIGPFGRYTMSTESHFLSLEPDEPTPSCAPAGGGWGTSWARYDAPGDHDTIRVSDPSGNVPGAVAIFTGDAFGNLHEVGCLSTAGAVPAQFELNHRDSLLFQMWTASPGSIQVVLCEVDSPAC